MFRVSDLKFQVSCLVIRVSGLGFRYFGFWVSCFRLQVWCWLFKDSGVPAVVGARRRELAVHGELHEVLGVRDPPVVRHLDLLQHLARRLGCGVRVEGLGIRLVRRGFR